MEDRCRSHCSASDLRGVEDRTAHARAPGPCWRPGPSAAHARDPFRALRRDVPGERARRRARVASDGNVVVGRVLRKQAPKVAAVEDDDDVVEPLAWYQPTKRSTAPHRFATGSGSWFASGPIRGWRCYTSVTSCCRRAKSLRMSARRERKPERRAAIKVEMSRSIGRRAARLLAKPQRFSGQRGFWSESRAVCGAPPSGIGQVSSADLAHHQVGLGVEVYD